MGLWYSSESPVYDHLQNDRPENTTLTKGLKNLSKRLCAKVDTKVAWDRLTNATKKLKKKEESIEFVGVVFWQHHRIRLLSATFLNFSVVSPAIIVASIIVQSAWLSQNIMWLQSEYNSRGKSGLVLGKIVTITKVWLYSKFTVLHYVS